MQLKKTASAAIKKMYKKATENYSSKLAGNKSLLYNKYVLYVSFIICLINLLIWMFSGEFIHVTIFLLVGYLTSFFSKNMIVILVISLVVSNVVKSGSNIVLEGMDNKESENEDGVYHPKGDKKEGMNKKKEGMKDKKNGDSEETEGLSKSKEDGEDSNEGIDDAPEGMDDTETPCTSDKDCEGGFRCNDKYVCVAAK